MGAVYLGQHQLLGRRAAIKVLLPELSARPDIVNRFFNEARAVTSISDPGIVQVFGFGYHSDGSAFIVMEYEMDLAGTFKLSPEGELRLALAKPCMVTKVSVNGPSESNCDRTTLDGVRITARTPWGQDIAGTWNGPAVACLK